MAAEAFANPNAAQNGRAISNAQLWTGRILSALLVLFLLMDGTMKLFKPASVLQATAQLGYAERDIVPIGMTLLVCTLLYILPRTAIFGAILLTGYFGGAIASQVRAANPTFNVIFAALFACLLWLGLWLRDGRVRKLLV
ncbi:MAG TPA: DoxX family protein [Bryobacteraceae bacterium]|nr:DoxX family protein [Bryobacteraceae bacterium]